jgi:hypothetical protein
LLTVSEFFADSGRNPGVSRNILLAVRVASECPGLLCCAK